MKRCLFTIVSALSLLVFGLVVALWVASYGPVVGRQWVPGHEVMPMRGQVVYFWWYAGWYSGEVDTDWRYLGFGYYHGNFLMVRVPYWFPALLTLVVPGCWLRYWLRQRRRRESGRCLKCGYDLRASDGCCPECGHPIPRDLVRRPLG